MYLFLFCALLAIFQYVNSKRILDTYEEKISNYKIKDEQLNNKIMELEDENMDLLYFNLENNDDALSYFERDGYDTATLIPFIQDELYKLNEVKGEHPIIPYAPMTNGRMLINKVRMLNHKWLIADFSDGKFWGELLIKYEITDKKELKFKLVEHLLYPPTN
jgi:hypothetical protein